MINKHFKSLLTTGCVMAAVVGSASAGGFSRGTADTDILFEQGNFNLRTSVTIVSPTREITVDPTSPLPGPDNVGHDYADTYAVPSGAVKFKLFDDLSCAGTVAQPYGGSVSYATPKVSTSLAVGKTAESFSVTEYGGTCGYKFDLAKGHIVLLGGIFLENFTYDLDVRGTAFGPFPAAAVDVGLKDSAVGWRAGLAYEIPEIALRAQVLYRSGTSLDPTGNATATSPPFLSTTGTASGAGKLPQSVELKLQSGIAPGWLAYANVKWTDWSVNKVLVLNTTTGFNSQNNYYWKDGWTVTGGIGHAFSESVSGTAFITWDRGVSTGYDLLADTYTFGVGASLKDTFGGELRLGGAISYLGSAAETQNPSPGAPLANGNYAVGSDWSFAASAGYAVKW